MNCDHVRAVLAVIRPDSGDVDLPEFAAEMLHLQQCADCQAQFVAQQQSDRELARAMRNVSIPADLNSRLLASLTAALVPPTAVAPAVEAQAAVPSPVAVPIQPVTRARTSDQSWTRRRAAAVASAAMLLLALGGWWLFQAPRQARLSVDDLLALCHSQTAFESPRFQGSFVPKLPDTEIRTPPSLQALTPLSLQAEGQEIGALVPYQVTISRGKTFSVVLIVIDLQKVQVPDLAAVGTSFQTAQVYYPKPNGYATRVWRVGQTLYVCYVRSRHPEDLDSLKARYQTS